MALEYSYGQAVSMSVSDFAAALHQRAVDGEVLRGDTNVDALLGRGAGLSGGAVVSVYRQAPYVLDSVVHDFDFAPTVGIVVRFDKFGDMRIQRDELVSLALAALDIDSGDAIGHVDYERVWLLRRDGRLVLGEHHLWTPEHLAMVPYPYERGELAFAEG